MEERFDDLTRIVKCPVQDLQMPIYPQKHYPGFQRGYEPKHLLDFCREIGSWIAFAVFLEYFPERKNSPEYIVAGNVELSLFRPGDHIIMLIYHSFHPNCCPTSH